MKKIFFLIIFVLLGILATKAIFAQETASNSATSVNLVFPISQLGNCSSATDCKTYCDDPSHVDACVAYAKEKGFYKDSQLDSSKDAILEDAKTTLGCDSLDSCRTFCQQAVNATVCSDFAKKHNLKGGQQQINNQTLAKAESVLGCSSEDSCKAFCQQETNKEKCATFAKENGLQGGNQAVGPGGCTSEASCKTFCSDPSHFQACSQFVQNHASGSAQKTFTGPGGCTSEASCHSYCDQNPTACHLNPTNHEVPASATDAARMQDTTICRQHPEQCRENQHEQIPPSGQPDNTAGSSGNITPPRPPHADNLQNNTSGDKNNGLSGGNIINQETGEGSKNIFPTVTQSVQAATTHKDMWSWIWDEFFHLR